MTNDSGETVFQQYVVFRTPPIDGNAAQRLFVTGCLQKTVFRKKNASGFPFKENRKCSFENSFLQGKRNSQRFPQSITLRTRFVSW